MNLQELLAHIDKKWHQDFIRFVDTGEASDAFLEYLNKDAGGQQAVEMAFTAQAQGIRGLAEELKNPPPAAEATFDPTNFASKKFARAVEGVLELPPDQRDRVVMEAASSLLSSTRPGRKREVEAVAEAFKENLGNVAAKA